MDLLTGVPIDQLDAATRKRLGLPLKGVVSGGPRKRTTKKEYTGKGLPVVCYVCKQPCDSDADQGRHLAETGHARYEVLTA